MSTVTEDNKEIFLAVVAWLLIAWGIYGIYYSTTQVILQATFSKEAFTLDLESTTTMIITFLDAFFAIAAIWLGSGLIRRKKTALRSFAVFGWLYIVTRFAITITSVVVLFQATSPLEAHSAEVIQAFGEARTVQLAYSARTGIALLAESVLILWVAANFRTDVIRQDFTSE